MSSYSIDIVSSFNEKYLNDLKDLYKMGWWFANRNEADIKVMLENTNYFFCAIDIDKDILVGFARVLTDKKYFAFIFDLIVDENYRKKGVGTRLLTEIKAYLKISGVENIELCCQPDLVSFYERNGFKAAMGRMQLRNV